MMFRALLFLILLGSFLSRHGCSRDQEQPLSSLRVPSAELDVLSAELGVEIYSYHLELLMQSSGKTIQAKAVPETDLQRCSSMLAKEMALYPRGFFKKIGINKIVLCSDLKIDEDSVGGLADIESNTIYLDVVAFPLSQEGLQENLSFHHEVFHFVDWRDDYQIDRDPGWNALNQGFQYGQGGESMLKLIQYQIKKPIPTGFLNWYSTSGICEDKAEIFAHTISNKDTMIRRAQNDKIIKQKILAIQRIVRGFDREFGDSIWNPEQLR